MTTTQDAGKPAPVQAAERELERLRGLLADARTARQEAAARFEAAEAADVATVARAVLAGESVDEAEAEAVETARAALRRAERRVLGVEQAVAAAETAWREAVSECSGVWVSNLARREEADLAAARLALDSFVAALGRSRQARAVADWVTRGADPRRDPLLVGTGTPRSSYGRDAHNRNGTGGDRVIAWAYELLQPEATLSRREIEQREAERAALEAGAAT